MNEIMKIVLEAVRVATFQPGRRGGGVFRCETMPADVTRPDRRSHR